MKVIGITGASGAGKSTLVESLSLPTVDADKAARKVTQKGHECLKKLAESFGDDILLSDGSLDRKALASKAFATDEKTALLNSITHPFIIKIIENELDFYRKSGERAVVLDAPQLFEAGCEKMCDFVIGVIADKDVRKARIMARDKIDENSAKIRLNAEKDDDFFKNNCDMIIINNGEIDKLKKEVDKILNLI